MVSKEFLEAAGVSNFKFENSLNYEFDTPEIIVTRYKRKWYLGVYRVYVIDGIVYVSRENRWGQHPHGQLIPSQTPLCFTNPDGRRSSVRYNTIEDAIILILSVIRMETIIDSQGDPVNYEIAIAVCCLESSPKLPWRVRRLKKKLDGEEGRFNILYPTLLKLFKKLKLHETL